MLRFPQFHFEPASRKGLYKYIHTYRKKRKRWVGGKGDDETGHAAKIIGSRLRAQCSFFFFFFYVYRVTDPGARRENGTKKKTEKKKKIANNEILQFSRPRNGTVYILCCYTYSERARCIIYRLYYSLSVHGCSVRFEIRRRDVRVRSFSKRFLTGAETPNNAFCQRHFFFRKT